MDKIFGKLNMSWLRVILFAIITGLYAGIMMSISSLYDTSFQDIGITYEWWVIFALIVVANCRKNWEAMAKCFVYFLISQPLIYIVEIIAGKMTVEMGLGYYYLKIWLPMTFMTLPGGFIAYYCRKQNLIGAIILGLAIFKIIVAEQRCRNGIHSKLQLMI